MKVLGWVTVLVGLFVFGPIWSGYVLSVLWSWFMVSAFHLPLISIPLAIGIGMVVRMLTYSIPNENEKGSKGSDVAKSLLRSMAWTFLYPALGLLLGYIVHLFV